MLLLLRRFQLYFVLLLSCGSQPADRILVEGFSGVVCEASYHSKDSLNFHFQLKRSHRERNHPRACLCVYWAQDLGELCLYWCSNDFVSHTCQSPPLAISPPSFSKAGRYCVRMCLWGVVPRAPPPRPQGVIPWGPPASSPILNLIILG